MSSALRELSTEELPDTYRLGRLAFGGPTEPGPHWLERVSRTRVFALHDRDGSIAAVARVRDYHQLYGGRPVSMGGLAGVAVAPEQRRRGLSRALLTGLLPVLRAAGHAVSALYPTVPEVYRRRGWETAGALRREVLQTAALATLPADDSVTLRQAHAQDEPALLACYQRLAQQGSGMLTRAGTQFPTGELLRASSIVLADRDGVCVGYYALDRPAESGPDSQLAGHDLIADDAGTLRTLLRSIGAYSPLVPRLELVTAPGSALPLICPAALEAPGHANPWMLRLVDAAAAVAARGWPAGLTAEVPLALFDDDAAWNTGCWRLQLADGSGQLVPDDTAPPDRITLDQRGLATLYTGFARCAELRRAGLLSGPDHYDPLLDAAVAGPLPTMTDYF